MTLPTSEELKHWIILQIILFDGNGNYKISVAEPK